MPAFTEQSPSNGMKVSARPQATIPPLTLEEEERIVNSRITNDERPIKRIIKKFHNYINVTHTLSISPNVSTDNDNEAAEDAREAFLVELASFQLLLKKNAMICEAEARQVEEYQREQHRIDLEHSTLRGQIEQLKTALEEAQLTRKRKMEYDLIAEKVNTLPTREELEKTIEALENDMTAIRDEHETQTRAIQSQKAALDDIISDLGSLRFHGGDPTISGMPSRRGTPTTESRASEGAEELETVQPSEINLALSKTEEKEEGEEGEEKSLESEINGDIEMGEVEEDTKNSRARKVREDLEEGEATDASSELSELADDI
ncbi:Tho complex subunit 7-domain-containing protein [Lentinula aff. detonsa]|uniref:Tho complex subunit 7-domain-containing protein n=1 Tax=Lentinula aff. detonsa TaxID=2804958 RepID=A0AA38NQU6_9AGAR|nr:Tho complex subunit 7-domain-containing protein [Lentinula aff. detonsa]